MNVSQRVTAVPIAYAGITAQGPPTGGADAVWRCSPSDAYWLTLPLLSKFHAQRGRRRAHPELRKRSGRVDRGNRHLHLKREVALALEHELRVEPWRSAPA